MKIRCAFTVIELLVVMVIIGILVGLLVPAIQAAREAARRVHCSNNLKQIGLGFQLYHDSYRQFPWGGRNYPRGATRSSIRDYWTWAYYLLPMLEQQVVFEQSDDEVIYGSVISTYYCPTRRRAQLYNGTSRLDYAGNAGSSVTGSVANGILVESGAAGLAIRPRISIAFVTDGTSQTVLVGEKQLHPQHLGGSNRTCCDDNEPYVNTGWDSDIARQGSRPPEHDRYHPGIANVLITSTIFGSRHPAGASVVMVDGSVHQVSWKVDAATFRNLCVRNDGNPVTNF